MSFLDSDLVDMAALDETLAFIDSMEWGDNLPPSANSSGIAEKYDSLDDSRDSLLGGTMKEVGNIFVEDAASKKQPKKRQEKAKRKRCTLSSSTRLQQRKKAEVLFLRKRVEEMEAYIEQLKVSKHRSQCLLDVYSTKEVNTSLMNLAKVLRHARLQSEEVNRRLKATMARQVQVRDSLRETLQKQASIQPLVFRRDFIAVDNESATMAKLQKTAAKLYLDSGTVFKLLEMSPSLSSSTQIGIDSNRNKVINIFTTTPVRCSIDVVNKLMIKELHNKRQYPDKWCQTAPGKQANVMEKKYVILVRSEATVVKVSGLQVACGFDEPNRTVYTGADVMVLTTAGLQFYLHTWIILTPSETDSLNSSVVRTCFRLSVDSMEGFSACTEDVRNAKETVLMDMCTRFHKHSQHVQDWLVEETERITVARSAVDVV